MLHYRVTLLRGAETEAQMEKIVYFSIGVVGLLCLLAVLVIHDSESEPPKSGLEGNWWDHH